MITENEEEMAPLHLVCRYYKGDNMIDFVKDLLLKGGNVNSGAIKVKIMDRRFTELTPLHLLFVDEKKCSLINIVKLLLENGSKVNAKSEHGDTPVHYSFFNYQNLDDMMGITRLFIQKGADFNVKNKDGRTPLHVLFHNNTCGSLTAEFVRLLINNGADFNAQEETKLETPVHYLCRFYNPMRDDRDTLLSLVRLLVDNGAILMQKTRLE